MSFMPIGNLLNRSVKRLGVQPQVTIALALERADLAIKLLLGDEISEHVRPMYIRHRTLNIASLSPSASSYLGQVQDEILEYVNRGAGKPIAERIRVIS